LASSECEFGLANADWGPPFFSNVNFVLEEAPNVNFVLSSAKSELLFCQVLNVSYRTAEIE
jgi:hypothetical protein